MRALHEAELYGVGRSTVSKAIGRIRALRARRGFAAPDRPRLRLRLRTLADVFAYAAAEGFELRIDGHGDPGAPPQGTPARISCVRLGQEKLRGTP